MPFSMRQQKLDKLCRTCKIDRSRLTKYCRGVSPASPVLWGGSYVGMPSPRSQYYQVNQPYSQGVSSSVVAFVCQSTVVTCYARVDGKPVRVLAHPVYSRFSISF